MNIIVSIFQLKSFFVALDGGLDFFKSKLRVTQIVVSWVFWINLNRFQICIFRLLYPLLSRKCISKIEIVLRFV